MTSMKETILIGFALVLFSLGAASAAEQLSIMSPEARLGRGPVTGDTVSDNVAMYRVPASDLPEQIQKEIGSIFLSCTGKSDGAKNVTAFAWVADWNRTQGAAPNYIVDMRQLRSDGDEKQCSGGPICSKEGCLLIGFAGKKEKTWQRNFTIRASEYTFASTKDENNKVSQEIQVLSKPEDCQAINGVKTKGKCFRRFTWRSTGLSLLATPSN